MDDDPRKQFYMLSSSYAYRGGCGGEGAGIETFPHMLAALESQLSWLIDFKQEPFPGNEYQGEKQKLEDAITQIKNANSDKKIPYSFLTITGNNVGYNTLAAGYWKVFIPDALSNFADDLDYKIEDAIEDDEDKEIVDELQDEKRKISLLQERSDILSEDFINIFFDIADAYSERHC